MRTTAALLALALILAISGCHRSTVSSDRELAWQLTRQWSLGGSADHHLSLSQLYPFQVAAGSDSSLYVLGWKEHRIYKISGDGRVVDSLGRQGEGPGEFVEPLALSVDVDGSISVVDLGSRRIVRWSKDHSILDPIPLTWHLDAPQVILEGTHRWYQTVAVAPSGTAEIQLVDVSAADTQVVARVPRQLRRVVDFPTCGGRDISVQAFFAPTVIWASARGVVVAAPGSGYDVEVFRPERPVERIHREYPPLAATREAALKEAEGYQFNGCPVASSEAVASIGYLPIVPRIQAVAVGANGETWIRRRTEDGSSRIDLFDGRSTYLGTLPRDFPMPAATLPGDRIVVVEKDSMDVPMVSVYQIHRTAEPPPSP